MFIAMNRFKVAKGEEAAFETVWSTRKTRLDEMPGFLAFHLLQGAGEGGSHAVLLPHHLGHEGRLHRLDEVGGSSGICTAMPARSARSRSSSAIPSSRASRRSRR